MGNKISEITDGISQLKSSMKSRIEKIRPNNEISADFEDNKLMILESIDWNQGIEFEYDIENQVSCDECVNKIEDFLNHNYIDRQGCYKDDYVEYIITLPRQFFYLNFNGYKLKKKKYFENKICYEIASISDTLINLIKINEDYDADYIEGLMALPTLKIYNINKVKSIKCDNNIEEEMLKIAKSIIFEIAYKHSIELKIETLAKDIEDEDDDPVYYMVEKIDKMDDNYVKKDFDSDLIDYYYRALQMECSEFKYLAFYQILECIFDEVYLHETVQDVKQIINSNWFSTYNNNDVNEVIKVVDQYNKNKNDREKLKLVLEKYYKGNIHDEAFYLANKDIIKILIDNIKKANHKEELKDLQKFSNILYEFRCKCTHSNRTFPFSATFDGSISELENYIELIKKVAERVIINYDIQNKIVQL